MNFRIGEPVVCVNVAMLLDYGKQAKEPVLNGVYVLRWVGMCDAQLSVRLVGVYRDTPVTADRDMPFFAWRFRPLVENKRKTSIELFQRIRKDAEAKDKVPV